MQLFCSFWDLEKGIPEKATTKEKAYAIKRE